MLIGTTNKLEPSFQVVQQLRQQIQHSVGQLWIREVSLVHYEV